MRTMLTGSLPVEKGNEVIADGTLGRVLQELLAQLKPEAAYFFTQHGKRTFTLVFDLNDSSQIPVIAEPLFSQFNAAVDFIPVMNQDDLMRGVAEAGLLG